MESRLVRILRAAGLPEPVRQHVVITPNGRIRLDLAYPDRKLAIEGKGVRWHGGAADVRRDAARSNLLVSLGWRVLEFTWHDATRRPADVAAIVVRELQPALPFAG